MPFPLTSTRVGTSPPGSQWARDPIPGCYLCDAHATCGTPLAPVPGTTDDPCSALSKSSEAQCEAASGRSGDQCKWIAKGGKTYCYDKGKTPGPAEIWDRQVNCYGRCDGANERASCPAGTAQFPAPAHGYSGFGKQGWDWSVADRVKVPSDLKPGAYLLSFRWDCEERCASHRAAPLPLPIDRSRPPFSRSTQVWQNCADLVLE